MKDCFQFWPLFAGVVIACSLTTVSSAQSHTPGPSTQAHADKTSTPAKIDWNAPLPSAALLKQRVIANIKQSEAEQERYVCKTTSDNVQTDKNGNIKHRQTKQYNRFFVNRQEVDQLTSKDGKPLNAEQQKKEQERVEKEIKKDSDMKYVAKQNEEGKKQLDDLLHMLRYTNGHRINLHGRSTLVYDLSGDPNVHPKGPEETFLHNMSGTIQVDEATGELVDLNAHLAHDVKVGGGLLANLHKGFWIHVHQQMYPDGVWLNDLAEGNGDARAALFFHPYFRFKILTNDCALTNVSTSEGATKISH